MMDDGLSNSLNSYCFYRDWKKDYPVVEKGEGIYVFDKNGKRYIDGSGGPCVVNIGHGVKEIIEALREQLDKICFPFAGHFSSDAQIELGQRVIEFSPRTMSKVYFLSGGSEASETALKFVRQYHIERGDLSRTVFVTRWKSYHGATLGALALSGHTKRRQDYIPYLINFPHIHPPYCYRCDWGKNYPGCELECGHELERIIKLYGPNQIAAFIAEPIIGNTAGVVIPPKEYWPLIRSICDRYGILLVADEVITGFGRTGMNFGVDQWDVAPDVIIAGKGISSGYTPLAGVIINEKMWDVFKNSKRSTFFLGYTFSGHSLACYGGVAVLKYMIKENLVERSKRMGEYLLAKTETLEKLDGIGDVRGRGLLVGIEFVKDKRTKQPFERSKTFVEKVTSECFKKGLILTGGSGGADGIEGDHIIISPPFTITGSQIDEVIEILNDSIVKIIGQM